MDRAQVSDLMRSLDDETRRIGLYVQHAAVQIRTDEPPPVDENDEPIFEKIDPATLHIAADFLIGDYAWRAEDDDTAPDPAASILPDDLADDLERNALRDELDLDLGDD